MFDWIVSLIKALIKILPEYPELAIILVLGFVFTRGFAVSYMYCKSKSKYEEQEYLFWILSIPFPIISTFIYNRIHRNVPYDPDVPVKYKKAASVLSICFALSVTISFYVFVITIQANQPEFEQKYDKIVDSLLY